MANSNDQTLNDFLNYFNAHDLNNVMAQFCANVPNTPPLPGFSAPALGITDHGPAFFGQTDVRSLFSQLFQSFLNMQWTQYTPRGAAAPVWLYSKQGVAPSEIGIQMTVTGTWQSPWFDNASGHASQPLSQLAQGTGLPLGRRRGDNSGLPAFAVFIFNNQYLIQQLQIYTDRYAMMQSITQLHGWDPDAPAYDAPHAIEYIRRKIGAEHRRHIKITIDD
jgi:hypothetical protein